MACQNYRAFTKCTVSDLSNQFEVIPKLINIPPSQGNSSKWYALIDGFESEEQAVMFISKWNETFTHGRINVRCEIDTTTDASMNHELNVRMKSNDRSTHSDQSIYDHDSGDDDNRSKYRHRASKDDVQQGNDDLHSSQGKSRSKRTPCRHGDSCFSVDCPYQHSPAWHACKKGAQCHDFACLASHPRNRKVKCKYGSACRTASCSYLHPNMNKSKDSNDSDDENSYNNTNKIHSQQYHQLKSLASRMAERQLAQLPIFASRNKFCERLQQEKILVVVAETSSGKSTQLPQYAAECFPDGLVVCTQPRAITAIALARQVADEYDGTSEGNSVGYQTGNRPDQSNGTNIMFMTDTALIYEFQMDSNLSRIRVLIIDEVHERSLHTDIVMGIAKLLLAKRKTDFYAVIASAIIDPKPFLNFFDRSSSSSLKENDATG